MGATGDFKDESYWAKNPFSAELNEAIINPGPAIIEHVSECPLVPLEVLK